MARITACLAGLTLASVAVLVPGSAHAAGCEVLRDVAERGECHAREQARDAARAEVRAAVDDASSPSVQRSSGRSAAWDAAREEAAGVELDSVLEPRPIAAVGGLAWFLLVVRSRRRARARARGHT